MHVFQVERYGAVYQEQDEKEKVKEAFCLIPHIKNLHSKFS
jgi:hypothetical protein